MSATLPNARSFVKSSLPVGASPFHPLNANSLAQESFLQIKRMILSGFFRPGERISEEKVAAILHVSRTPIREALRQLEQNGLVVLKPRSYAKVAALTEDEAREIAVVRGTLESLVFRELLANGWLNTTRLTALTQSALDKLAVDNIGEAYLLDSAFHLELARQSGNNTLYGMLERLDAKIQLVRLWTGLSPEQYHDNLGMHFILLQLLESGDVEGASTFLGRHITPAGTPGRS